MVLSGFRRNQCARRVRVDAATPRRAETMGRKRQNKPSPRDQLGMELERRLGPGRLELELWSFRCGFGSLFIQEDAVANDKRILAHVSREEARTYIRGVNAHHEKGTRRYRLLMRGCLACFLLGAALFGTLMGVFFEEPRIRCEGRLCEPGEDPLVDGCCMFWCCGDEMKADKVRGRRLRGRGGGGGKGSTKGNKKKKDDGNKEDPRGHELKTRPYDRWDVWANETYFDDTERCALYDEKHDPLKKLDKKRDAGWGCETCPGGKSKCRTMFEGKARRHETWWPWLFLIPVLLPVIGFNRVIKYGFFETQRLYEEAFEEWFAGSVINHVEFQIRGDENHKGTMGNHLLLWFVGKDKAAAQKKHEGEVRARLEAQYDRNGRSDDPKKLRQQYDEQVLAGGPLRDWLDDHSAKKKKKKTDDHLAAAYPPRA